MKLFLPILIIICALDLAQGYWWSNYWNSSSGSRSWGGWSWSWNNSTGWSWNYNSTYYSPPTPVAAPVAAPVNTPASNPSSLANHKVLVRTFFTEIVPQQAQVIDVVMETTLDNYTATGTVVRKLRASRDLQTFCRAHCSDPRYGCAWCKLNDIFYGANCNNYCGRRELQANSALPGNDTLATSYVSNRNLFTPEQDETCAQLLATIELATNVANALIEEAQCYLVPSNFTIPGSAR